MTNKNMQSGSVGILVAIIAILLIGGGVLYFNAFAPDAPAPKEVMKTPPSVSVPTENIDTVQEKETVAKKYGTYEPYASEKIAKAETGKVVLFFHASWCSSCRALTEDIKANLGAIPENVTILDVDYDTSAELKKKYKVTTQHTLVQVDAKGEQIKQWKGSPTLAALVGQIQ
jgi:thiol-disulfide isomerase/thioredoxin